MPIQRKTGILLLLAFLLLVNMLTLFRDKLHCPDALFLDGTISSLHAPELKRSDSRADLGPIIAVTE